MPTGTTQYGYLRNDTVFDGSGNLTPIEAGDAVNVSFFAKKVGASGGIGINTVNVYLSEDGNSEWTCIVGKRAEGSLANENFAPSTAWTRVSYTAEAPVENGDNDYTGGAAVATWTTASIQITGSHFVPYTPATSGEYTYSTAYDDFKITANKPQVHVSNDGILIYHSGDNYIQMGAEGLNIRGGNIQANAVEAPTVSSAEFQVKDKIINFESGSDIVIGTQDTTEQAAADLYLTAGHSFQGSVGAGSGGGNIILTPGSGSGTDGHLGNGQGLVIIGPSYTPRMILSGSVVPTLGENDCEMQFKDPLGDKGVCFFTKQTAGLDGAGEGLFKVVCPTANGRLSLGAGSWTSSNNIVIAENGRVIIQPTGGANATATSALYELNVVGDINYSGNLTNVSDRRLKIDIEDITGSLEVVNNLEPVRFNKIGYRTIVPDTGNPRRDGMNVTQTSMSEDNTVITGSRVEIGFIAQDVLPYVPEIVMSGSVGGHYSLDYAMLTTHLVGAIKKLKAEVDALKNVSHSHG